VFAFNTLMRRRRIFSVGRVLVLNKTPALLMSARGITKASSAGSERPASLSATTVKATETSSSPSFDGKGMAHSLHSQIWVGNSAECCLTSAVARSSEQSLTLIVSFSIIRTFKFMYTRKSAWEAGDPESTGQTKISAERMHKKTVSLKPIAVSNENYQGYSSANSQGMKFREGRASGSPPLPSVVVVMVMM